MRINSELKKMMVLSALTAVCALWMGGENARAAAEPVIAKLEAIMYLDGRNQISVQGEGIQSVSYYSSKKKIAKIDKKGKVTPLKKGKPKFR